MLVSIGIKILIVLFFVGTLLLWGWILKTFATLFQKHWSQLTSWQQLFIAAFSFLALSCGLKALDITTKYLNYLF